MKRTPEYCSPFRHLLGFAFAAALTLPGPSLAAGPVLLATEPLTSSTASNVKPNLMFIFDDSGSMAWDYLPDWANDSHPVLGTNYNNMPELFTNSGFNGVAYNPAITYSPPVYYNAAGGLDTTTYPSYTTWTAVKRDGYGVLSTSTDNLVGNTSYYTFTDGEYCSTLKKTNCVPATAAAPVAGYDIPAGLRWCDSAALSNCQSINNSTFRFPRYPGGSVPATATINITGSGSATSITVNGFEILSAPQSSGNRNTLASRIANSINNCTSAISGNCTIAGYSASRSGRVVTISAPLALGAITYLPVDAGTMSTNITAFSGFVTVPGTNDLTNVVSTTTTYPKATTRTDCAGTTCTYAEEMTNHANWWAYYHTRVQAMKTSVSRAFKTLDSNYRVGYSTIKDTAATAGSTFLDPDTFELAHKNKWFDTLFATVASGSTPLRGALSRAGQYYAHKIGPVDPIQYSCQQNFAILSTDGYWNTNNETSTFGPYGVDGALVGDWDNAAPTSLPSDGMYQGPTATSNTLADVAKYYYETDLRDATLWGNCAGASSPDFPSGNPNVCLGNVFTSTTDTENEQHMTTFTMGLGADGVLNFQSDYDTASSGDFYDLKNALGSPVVYWPRPTSNSSSTIDDLWHAAVNGRGSYFSAKDPDAIISGFNEALSSITAKLGSAAAAATSTLNPVSGNNYAYLASYTTVKWTGNLEARIIDPNSGDVSTTADWCVENILQDTCLEANKQEIPPGSGFWSCVVPVATSADCPAPGSYAAGPPSTCTTSITNKCTGSMTRPPTVNPMVSATGDNRTIYTAPDGATSVLPGQNLVMFDSAYAAANPASFNPSTATPPGPVDGLSQWATISSAHTAGKLINYLRGQTGYEVTPSNLPADRLYRKRNTVLGDTLESQPAFIANPVFSYVYAGYPQFKSNYASRNGTVYVGSNDGMLHAFVGKTVSPEIGGKERWAYVPSMSIPNMWKLADTNYSTQHSNFINGSPVIADICVAADCSIATAADWRTILVAGLNGGGRGYFALDITDPAKPILLWEFTTTKGIGTVQDDDLGYSFGRPVITRKATGEWVVVVTSGYNNINPGTGGGFLFVLNAATGSIVGKYPTGAGSTVTPSGLSGVSVWNEAPGGNEGQYAYATDLQGNIWRFDITTATGTSPLQFATLKDSGGQAQPITTAPILGLFKGHRLIIVGTGKYLEVSDLTNVQTQSIYAIKDVGAAATWLDSPRTYTGSAVNPNMIQQTITPSGSVRTGSKLPVDLDTDLGWFIDLPDSSTGSERVNISSKLVLGTLLVPTIVPSSTVCSPGGYGWFNFFDYSNGWPIPGSNNNENVSIKKDSPIVGFNVLFIKGKPVVLTVTADGNFDKDPGVVFGMPSPEGFSRHKSLWRELLPQ